ncbi:hypothetical protein [Pseudarthrobacter sp. BRE9]|nr:hypothetical protein [Pseudarthrobacter sp. BRE9]MDT0167781.1 hypothetical protein [Pseudarthrobacter sp. BRE9]
MILDRKMGRSLERLSMDCALPASRRLQQMANGNRADKERSRPEDDQGDG